VSSQRSCCILLATSDNRLGLPARRGRHRSCDAGRRRAGRQTSCLFVCRAATRCHGTVSRDDLNPILFTAFQEGCAARAAETTLKFFSEESVKLTPKSGSFPAEANIKTIKLATILFWIERAFDSAKNHKRQRRKRQSVTAKREKSQTPKFV